MLEIIPYSGRCQGTCGVSWGSTQISPHGIGRANDASARSSNIGYRVAENNLSLVSGGGNFGRSIRTSAALNSSYGAAVAYGWNVH